MPQKPTPSDNN